MFICNPLSCLLYNTLKCRESKTHQSFLLVRQLLYNALKCKRGLKRNAYIPICVAQPTALTFEFFRSLKTAFNALHY